MMQGIAVALALLASAGADEGQLYPPQPRGAQQQQRGLTGLRVWAEVELFRGELEVDGASGNAPEMDSESDFKSGIDTTLQQGIFWIAAGYEMNMGVMVYGKLGYSFPAMIQEIGSGSVFGPPGVRQGGGIDPFVAYGLGLSFHTEPSGGVLLLGRVEWTTGRGDLDNYLFQNVAGDGDFDYTRLELRAAIGYPSQMLVPYVGVRYNMLAIEMDLSDGTDAFDVEYEMDTAVGLFVGVTGRVVQAQSSLWHVEAGFVDALTAEVGVGLSF